MSIKNWGKLVRDTSGFHAESNIPVIILLFDKEQFIGRLPNADVSKFRHSQQIVIPSPFMSSTHFSIEMRSPTEETKQIAYFLTDHSRNGTFFRRKQLTSSASTNRVEAVGQSKTVQMHDGDEIILKFQNEIKLAYVFTVTTCLPVVEDDNSAIGAATSRPDIEGLSNVPPSSSRKRLKTDKIDRESTKRIMTEGVKTSSVAGEEQKNSPQIISLQLENKELERRLASIVAANSALSTAVSTVERELRNSQATVSQKNIEISSVTSSLRESEANSAATEARLRKLEDITEVIDCLISLRCY